MELISKCHNVFQYNAATAADADARRAQTLKACSHGPIFLNAIAFFNEIAVLQCEQYH